MINIAALQQLFPAVSSPMAPRDSTDASFYAGWRLSYESLLGRARNGFSPKIVSAVESVLADERFGPIFQGDLSNYSGDHSRADLALCGEFARLGLDKDGIDFAIRTSGLYREKWEKRDDYRNSTISKAFASVKPKSGDDSAGPDRSQNGPGASSLPFDLEAAVPIYSPGGMPARDFAGPPVDRAQLFPMNALSLLVALGGTGKTAVVIKIAAHIAAGKPWGAHKIIRRKVLVFSVEESQDELNRRYGAAVDDWTNHDRDLSSEYLRLISCLGRDVRLTKIENRHVKGSDVGARIIQSAKEFGAEVIILDHLQGFASGDLNNSDTATELAMESNRIVADTGAAVIQTAHISKGNINATDVVDGFTTGSLAFENAARQVTGVIPLADEEARKIWPLAAPGEFLSVGMPKNSYGPSRGKGYLRKVRVPHFHTITVEPIHIPAARPLRTAIERIADGVLDYVKNHPGTTQNKLEGLAGKAGRFKATKRQLRQAITELEDEERLIAKRLSKEERKGLGLPHQVSKVYEHVERPVDR